MKLQSASPTFLLQWFPGTLLQKISILILVLFGLWMAQTVNGYLVFVLASVALYAIVGIGLNALMGLVGQVSFGHVGFYAIGAYAVAILTTQLKMSFWFAWLCGAVLSGVIGAVISLPALRVRGPYLAMLTIAFGFIVEHVIIELRDLTGGQNGIMGIKAPEIGSWLQGERAVAVIAILTALCMLWLYALLNRSTWGAAMRAVKNSEIAAQSIGIDPVHVKTLAFVFSAVLTGLAGGLFAPLSGFVTPNTFGFSSSILFVLVVMIGGAGSVSGPLVGALIVAFLPELLSSLEEYRLLFFGVLLLVVLLIAPSGLVGVFIRLKQYVSQTIFKNHQNLKSADHVMPVRSSLTGETFLPKRARAVLDADALYMVFGGLNAVSDLSLEVVPGRITSLIGPNGAGKSTVINMLTGFYLPTQGVVKLANATVSGLTAWRSARLGVARTYQTSLLFGSLSVLDNIVLASNNGRLGSFFSSAGMQDIALTNRSMALLNYCGFTGDMGQPAADLAHVDRRLVEIARALATDPDVLLLDEPAAGLSREDKDTLSALLKKIAQAGVGVLVVEHDMKLVMHISDQIVVIDSGKRLAIGTPNEIQTHPEVIRAYLGQGEFQPICSPRVDHIRTVTPTVQTQLLGVQNLTTGYGAAPVLKDVSFEVRSGELVALLGANGAGKSTLMRTLAGLHRPVQANMHFDGVEIDHLNAEQIVSLGLILVPEGRQVFPELTVLDNIRLGAFRCPEDAGQRIEEMLERFPRLRERITQRAGLLSGGEQQMLAIARGLMAQPRLLLLDEPSLGLAPKIIEELFNVLNDLKGESLTILLVDQMASLALSLADRAYVIESGQIVAAGSSSEIASNPALTQAYLGIAH